MPRHKHADLMIAYANDTSLVIEASGNGKDWKTCRPCWDLRCYYRIKPTPKKAYVFLYDDSCGEWYSYASVNVEIVEDRRNTMLSEGYKVTDIKEVVFE